MWFFVSAIFVVAIVRNGRLIAHISDIWNVLDLAILSLVSWVCVCIFQHTAHDEAVGVATFATTLIWFRAIQYLGAVESTALFVRMFITITWKMATFLVMLGLIMAGNGFVQLQVPAASLKCMPGLIDFL